MLRRCRLKVVRQIPVALAQSLSEKWLAICAHTDSGSAIEEGACWASEAL